MKEVNRLIVKIEGMFERFEVPYKDYICGSGTEMTIDFKKMRRDKLDQADCCMIGSLVILYILKSGL